MSKYTFREPVEADVIDGIPYNSLIIDATTPCDAHISGVAYILEADSNNPGLAIPNPIGINGVEEIINSFKQRKNQEIAKNGGILMVVRDCCNAHQCQQCCYNDWGKNGCRIHLRVIQFLTYLPAMAEKVKKNFERYNSVIVPATEETISILTPECQAYVLDRLSRPENINNRMLPS